MSDFAPGRDRISTPDETTAIRGESDSGIKERWEKVRPPPEESESSHSEPFVKGERVSGGGQGGFETIVNDPGSNPEMGSLLKDFLREKYPDLITREGDYAPDEVLKLGKEFDEWQNTEGVDEKRDRMPAKGAFNLKLNQRALEKYTTEAERGVVKDWWGLFTHGKNEIGWLGFEVDKDEKTAVRVITGVTLVAKDGDRTTIPAHVFRTVFENVLPSKKPRTEISTGFEFVGSGGVRGSIYPGMTVGEVKEVMKRVKVDGRSLPDDTIFFIG